MFTNFFPQVVMRTDASGAYQAGKAGDVVVIVDVIDMSTTIECAIEAGCSGFYGAAPDQVNPPVPVNPEMIGYKAGRDSALKKIPIVIVSEPRWGTERDFKQSCKSVIKGIEKAGGMIEAFVPNLGLTTVKLKDFKDKLIVAVTETGGTAFDAAYNAGGFVLTGTIARTTKSKGVGPALIAARRALEAAFLRKKNISVIAASSNSLEDVLAAQFIVQKILELARS